MEWTNPLSHLGLVQHECESMTTELSKYFKVCLNVSYIDRLCFSEATGTRSWLSTAPLQTPAAWWNCSVMRETEMVTHCCFYIMSTLCNNADVLATEQHTHTFKAFWQSTTCLLKVKHSSNACSDLNAWHYLTDSNEKWLEELSSRAAIYFTASYQWWNVTLKTNSSCFSLKKLNQPFILLWPKTVC